MRRPRFRGESVFVLAAVGGRHERSSTSPPRIDAQDGGCHDATLTHQGSRGSRAATAARIDARSVPLIQGGDLPVSASPFRPKLPRL
jgi:hypothetical protein